MSRNRIFLFTLFLLGTFYLERMISFKVHSLEERLANLKALIAFTQTGKAPAFKKNVELSTLPTPIRLCGKVESEHLVLELIPFKTIRIWYGPDAFNRSQHKPRDEEWPYLLKDGRILSENESLQAGILFQDDKSLLLVGPSLYLSNDQCLSQ